MARNGYSPSQRRVIERCMVGLDRFDVGGLGFLADIPPHIAALKLSDDFVHAQASHGGRANLVKSRSWPIFLDLQTTASPRLIKNTLARYVDERWQPRFISLWALGSEALTAAIEAVRSSVPREGTDLVVASVPSWMSEESCKEAYHGGTPVEVVAEHTEMAKRNGVEWIMTSSHEMHVVAAAGLKGIATAIRRPDEDLRGQVRVSTLPEAFDNGAQIAVLASTVVEADQPYDAFMAHVNAVKAA